MYLQLHCKIKFAFCTTKIITIKIISNDDQFSLCERLKLKIIIKMATIQSKNERRFISRISVRISLGMEISLQTKEAS